MPYHESNKLKQIAALAGIVVLGGFLLFSLSGFIPSFLGAVIFYVICAPAVNFFKTKLKFRKTPAVIVTLILSLLIIVLPVFSLSNMLISRLEVMLSSSQDIYGDLLRLNELVNTEYGINVLSAENFHKLQSLLTNIIPNLLEQTVSIIADIAVMYFILFYMLYSETLAEKNITRLLPYTKENSELFAKELVSQTYSNIIGAPLLAIIQALFSALGFWIFGLQEPFFWGVMCGFLSFIPLVGTALIWIPAGIILLMNGASWQGIGLLIYGAVIIINIDNVFRFVLQKKIGDIHPLVTVFGVIVGMQWFGVPGLIFGPLLISYLLIMLKLYRAEYGGKNYIM